MRTIIILAVGLIWAGIIRMQQVGLPTEALAQVGSSISADGSAPNNNAMLDVQSPATGAGKGILIPRLTQAQRTTASASVAGGLLDDSGNLRGGAAQGLIVYQTDGSQGLYFNTSQTPVPVWVYLGSSTTNYLPLTGGTMSGALNMGAQIVSNVAYIDFNGDDVAVGRDANGASSSVAIGRQANGSDNGVAVGYLANGTNYGAALGKEASGAFFGAALGYQANGYYSGAAVGHEANGTNSGAALGKQASGSFYGAALGFRANGINYGVAAGQYANGAFSGAAVGDTANGSVTGVAVGASANGYDNGVAVGYMTTGSTYGAALGQSANGANYGAAAGYRADGYNYGAAVGLQANGNNYGAAVGYGANGYIQAAAVGYAANGYFRGAAMGVAANGAEYGAALGYLANGYDSGVAVGRSANGSSYGAALGYFAQATNYGAAVGYLANGYDSGVALGFLANGAQTNVAIGFRANAGNGTNQIAIGNYVTNDQPDTVRIRGKLYLDGASGGVYTNVGGFGSSDWGLKAFTIDHPLDPENKILRHYCLESPQVWNVYAGNAQLVNGQAVVRLPDYYSALNLVGSEIYSLTPISSQVQANAVVKQKVLGNAFVIAGNMDMEVSWTIKVLRNDPGCLADLQRRPVEQFKKEFETGN